ASAPRPDPAATRPPFLGVPRSAPARVQVPWLKQGKTAAPARAALIQDGSCVLDTTVPNGRLGGPGDGGLSWTGEPPVLPPAEECTGFADFAGATRRNGYAGQVDLRLDPPTSGWLRGRPQ